MIYLNYLDAMKKFNPLSADHPLVLDPIAKCPGCKKLFVAGDVTTLVIIGPGDDEEAREKARSGAYYSALDLRDGGNVRLSVEERKRLQETMGDVAAPEGTVWACRACGKTAHKRYGGKNSSLGWDESCMMHAILINVEDITEPAEWKPYDRVRRVA